MKLGILPLGRPTFDVPFAEDKLDRMLRALDNSGHAVVGPRELLFDAPATETALANLKDSQIDHLLLLQVTFTDASMTVAAANAMNIPLSIWAIPEPRLGGRLRLNSFCGLNLASHALGKNHRVFSWLYADPDKNISVDLNALLDGKRSAGKLDGVAADTHTSEAGRAIAENIAGKRIACIGEHPVGFDTCEYRCDALKSTAGVEVDRIELDHLFTTARAASAESTEKVRKLAEGGISGLDQVDPVELDNSFRLKAALDTIRDKGKYDAFAIRCWPETFTEYGGAVCGPASMMGEAKVPCACEADVYGALTQLVLQETARAPVFLSDLVDVDVEDGTGVIWHCGQAPLSMRAPDVEAEATIHTNRKMPLLYEFPLKAGRVTFMRISQAHGDTKMVLAGGEMLARPMAFTGTSGVVKFDRDAGVVLNDIIASGLEHHMALAYGEHRPLLRSVAAAMSLPVLEL